MQSIAPAPVPQMHQHQHQEMSADNDLRAQLAAAINPSQHHAGASNAPHHEYNDPRASSSASPREHNIDLSLSSGGQGQMLSASALAAGDSGGDDAGGKGGKRELSQSKRAAQNRAAQRAFRQRKEGYIKKLEEQVRELHVLEDNFKSVQAENYSLREYIIHLQSRLIESQGDMPPPPPNVSLQHPGAGQAHPPPPPPPSAARNHGVVNPAGPHPAPMTQLQATTARNIAVAGLQSGKHGQEESFEPNKRLKPNESAAAAAASDEDVIRAQLQGPPQRP